MQSSRRSQEEMDDRIYPSRAGWSLSDNVSTNSNVSLGTGHEVHWDGSRYWLPY
jgi:hypothetical protein